MHQYIDKILNDPQSMTAESFRTLRTNIKFACIDKEVKSVLFTSTGPQEGKSYIVANLAISMSQAGKRVLIIDADLRNPSQHKIFGLLNNTGLTTTLAENESAFASILKTPHQGLDILKSGPIPPNPAELLESQRMRKILHEMTREYDFVLIDSPPVMAVTDAAILAQFVDGVILVLASGKVRRDYALLAKQQLEKVGAKILGMVINKVKMEFNETKYYSYYGKQKSKEADADEQQVQNNDDNVTRGGLFNLNLKRIWSEHFN